MTTGGALYAVLVLDPTLQALIPSAVGGGIKVFPNVVLQNIAPPYVVYSEISAVPENSLAGASADRIVGSRMQFDCYAKTYGAAKALADAVAAVIANLSRPDLNAWLDASRDLYDDATELHRVSADFSVWR